MGESGSDPTPGTHPVHDLSSLCLTITEHAPLPMATVEGVGHIVRYVNPAFCRLMDRPREELVGRSFRELLPEGDYSVSLLDRVFRTGKAASHTERQHSKPHPVLWSYAMWPVIADGRPAGVMVQVTETAHFHEETLAMNEALILGSLRQHELTEAADAANAQLQEEVRVRELAEDALRASEGRYRALFGSMPVAVFACDRAGLVQSYNRRAAELWRREPSLGDPAGRYGGPALLHAPDGTPLPLAESPMLEVLRTGISAMNVEMLIERPDGSRLPVIVNFAALKNAQGGIVGAITSFDDISERKAAEEALRDAAERKNEFLAMLAHELRNPLAPIRFALEIAKRAEGNSDLMRPALGTMERQLGQMTRLVDDLLDVSRISVGKLNLRLEEIELGSVIRPVIEAFRPDCDSARHELTVTLPQQPVYLNADPVRLAQVFGNLINNACKFTAPGGRISLAAERQVSDVVVTVRDSGIGISSEVMPNIFEIFTQGDPSLERMQGGLGIGLTLVRRLVEMHGGSVEAFSDGLGRGSEFVVRLPALAEKSQPPAPGPSESEPGAVAARRILVVDDNHDTANSLAMLLRMSGIETHTAFDGEEALEAAATFKPDVILLDIGLPKLNGYDTARLIREKSWGRGVVLVALTGWGQDEDREKTADAGFDAHLVKPVGYDALTRLLASYPTGGGLTGRST